MSLLDRYTTRQIEEMPLMVLHAALERMEREIDNTLADYSETIVIPGEGYRAKWELVRDPEDIDRILPIDRATRHEYATLAKLCRRLEAEEIKRLRAEFRQSSDPAIAKVISEAIAIERGLS